MRKLNTDNIAIIKRGLTIALLMSIIGELIFFPSLANFIGCLMALLCLKIFLILFKRQIILQYPFSFCMFLSMFLYRYIPLIATLFEGKPISYGFEIPFETFIFETLLFVTGALAYYFACYNNGKIKNNIINKALFKLNFFDVDTRAIWCLGFLGIAVRLYNFNAGEVEFGDVGGKFISALNYLMLAPIVLFFPTLLNLKKDPFNQKKLWMYIFAITALNIASNSRQNIIAPFGLYLLLYFLYMLQQKIQLTSVLSPKKIMLILFIVFFGFGILADLSLAMLKNRAIRSDISKTELFQQTLITFQDDKEMSQLRATARGEKFTIDSHATNYNQGWTEDYIDNFMLNRYANIRISDETIYLANKVGYGNDAMQTNFNNKVLDIFPTNFLFFLGVDKDKSKTVYSSGDYLYFLASNIGLGGFRVTSHIGDGLANFGIIYFPLQFICWFLVFKLLNCFIFFTSKGEVYSVFGLMNVFIFLGMFRNANGIVLDISYVIRGFWQSCFTYLFVFFIVKFLLRFFPRKYLTKRIN